MIEETQASRFLKDWVRPSIQVLVPYSSARDEYDSEDREIVFLDANENPFDNGVNRYPDPYQRQLKTKLSSLKRVPADHVLLGNGSDEVLDLVFRVFCQPGEDSVLICPPTYGMYKVWSDINQVVAREVPLLPNFQLDLRGLEKACEEFRPKAIFLCSPNNPTANTLKRQDIERLFRIFKGPIVIDEAYSDFSKEESWVQSLSDYPNLIVTQTLSKARGMAGLRIGMCFAQAQVIALMNRVKPPYNISTLNQQTALELLEGEERYLRELEQIRQERDRLCQELSGLAWVDHVFPSETNFLLFRVDDARKRYLQLLESGIVIRDRSRLPHCDQCLRATVGTPEENRKFIHMAKQLEP